MLKKIAKKNIFCAGPHPPSELHIRIFSFSDSRTTVHWILFYLQIHVPGYMMFCFFFKSMYPGTWNFDFSSNPCTPVHGIQIFFIILMVGLGSSKWPKKFDIYYRVKSQTGLVLCKYLTANNFESVPMSTLWNFWKGRHCFQVVN